MAPQHCDAQQRPPADQVAAKAGRVSTKRRREANTALYEQPHGDRTMKPLYSFREKHLLRTDRVQPRKPPVAMNASERQAAHVRRRVGSPPLRLA
jgi:hypothetical protein